MIAIRTAIPYGPGPREILDAYSPKRPGPVIVYLYGGSWQSGRRQIYRFLGRAFARRGFLTVIPDYRVYPEVRFPVFPEDAARILRFVREHAAEWGGDPGRIFLIGHSAGAHSAVLAAFEPERYGTPPLAGVIAIAGPMSFNPLDHDSVSAAFEGYHPIDDARPIKRVRAGAPPLLLQHGRADKTVGMHNSQHLADAIMAAGGHAELRLYPGLGHVGIVAAMAWPLRWRAPVLTDIVRFVRSRAGETVHGAITHKTSRPVNSNQTGPKPDFKKP